MDQIFSKSSLPQQTGQLNKESQGQKTVHQEVEVFSGRTLESENLVFSMHLLPNELIFYILKKLTSYRDLQSFRCTSREMEQVSIKFMELEAHYVRRSILQIITPSLYESDPVYYEYKHTRKGLYRMGVTLDNDREYKVKKIKVLSVYSCLRQESESKNKLQMVGILDEDKQSKFYLDGECPVIGGENLNRVKMTFNYSGTIELSGILKVSPDWRRLFSEMQYSEIKNISMGIKVFNPHYLFNDWFKSSFNEECLRENLITLFQNIPLADPALHTTRKTTERMDCGQASSTIKHQASSIKHQASSIKHQASSINHQASTIKHQPSTIKHQPSNTSSKVLKSEKKETLKTSQIKKWNEAGKFDIYSQL